MKLHKYFSCLENQYKEESLLDLITYMKYFEDIYVLYNFDLVNMLLCFEYTLPLERSLQEFGYPLTKMKNNDPLSVILKGVERNINMNDMEQNELSVLERDDYEPCYPQHLVTITNFLLKNPKSIHINPETLGRIFRVCHLLQDNTLNKTKGRA
jgi:hypothetical protein